MVNSTVCQSKWKPIVEPRRAKPKTYRQAPSHWLKFYEEAVIESEARTVVVQLSFYMCLKIISFLQFDGRKQFSWVSIFSRYITVLRRDGTTGL